MPRPALRTLAAAGAFVVVAGLAAACSSGGDDAQGGSEAKVALALSDAGCAPNPASVPAGPVTFTVTNSGTAKVTEGEIQKDNRILGEKENITEGISGDFSLRLDPGTYTVYCPGAAQDTAELTVTGQGGQSQAPVDASLATATAGYKQYVENQVAALVPASKAFTDAVRAGDVARAQALYAPARYHYETIEPVAESFGDLDPAIDLREPDVEPGQDWTGFHRIEKSLWTQNTAAGMAPYADKLDADIAKLQAQVAGAEYQPAQLANGASELLTEVSTSKVTGEEDAFSHTDLSDFDANIAGAQQAFELLKPSLQAKDPALATQLQARFTGITDELTPFRRGESAPGIPAYVDYSTVSEEQRRVLADRVNALAEPLSQVSGKVA
ncbi:iron uptake system protein EfeO [Actinomycetospora sp. NBRC 106378]|uniref:iron uptake system protein EfeO n=1 Tax=Actinomycetospora sp. NBRC 106378 TaxID=3032208 RepID=UPI0024A2DD90|nr:iron uptake system protein EfeO [Actinomycetospora sp. NBRC 106378]GLZ55155.1 lipoprotein [Actinomycetospora sp. NBRC 106378]